MSNLIRLEDNEPEVIQRCVKLLKDGAILVLPFDTVYGFCCDATNDRAIKKIYAIKKRSLDKPIGVAVGELNQLSKLVKLSEKTSRFIRARVPGKFTFILEFKTEIKISGYCLKNGTIAVRVPKNDLISKIIKFSGLILAQTSANVAGNKDVNKISALKAQFGDEITKIDLVIDGGEIKNSAPSKIYDLTSGEKVGVERNQ